MTTENVKNFGIEIECYNVKKADLQAAIQNRGLNCETELYNHTTASHWKIISDGSIRGYRGAEIVSPILNGSEGLQQVSLVCDALEEIGAKVNSSCGFHVHHEASNLTVKQMKNLIKMYARCEDVIDSFMPPSRRASNNSYCASTKNLVRTLSHHSNLQGYSRYTKLNFQSWYRQGTVEFRQHSGTTDYNKISNWIIFTAQFLATAKNVVSRTTKPAQNKSCVARLLKINNTPIWDFYKNRIKALA